MLEALTKTFEIESDLVYKRIQELKVENTQLLNDKKRLIDFANQIAEFAEGHDLGNLHGVLDLLIQLED